MEKIVFNQEDLDLSLKERTRNRMKIQLKLSADQASVLKNFYITIRGLKEEGFKESDFNEFLKAAMFCGIDAFQTEFIEKAKFAAKTNPELRTKLEEAGVKFDSEGNIVEETDETQPNNTL